MSRRYMKRYMAFIDSCSINKWIFSLFFLRIAPIYQITFGTCTKSTQPNSADTYHMEVSFSFCFVCLFLFMHIRNIFSAAEHSPRWSYREPRRTLQGALPQSTNNVHFKQADFFNILSRLSLLLWWRALTRNWCERRFSRSSKAFLK